MADKQQRFTFDDEEEQQEPTSTALIVLENVCKQFAQIKNRDEAQKFRDHFEAERHYRRQRKLGIQAVNEAGLLKILAEKKLGEFLKENVKPGRPNKLSDPQDNFGKSLPQGISRNQSAAFQKLCQLTFDDIEKHYKWCNSEGIEITTSNTLALLKGEEDERSRSSGNAQVDGPIGGVQRNGEANQEVSGCGGAAPVSAAPVSEVCMRCQRVGQVKDCQDCAKLQEQEAKKPKGKTKAATSKERPVSKKSGAKKSPYHNEEAIKEPDPNKSIDSFCQRMMKAFEEWKAEDVQKNNPWLFDQWQQAQGNLDHFCNHLRRQKADEDCKCKGLGCRECHDTGKVPGGKKRQMGK